MIPRTINNLDIGSIYRLKHRFGRICNLNHITSNECTQRGDVLPAPFITTDIIYRLIYYKDATQTKKRDALFLLHDNGPTRFHDVFCC